MDLCTLDHTICCFGGGNAWHNGNKVLSAQRTWPRFDSWTMRVDFVGSLLCSQDFFSQGTLVFHSTKTNN